jgi:hypothetical protein
MLSEYEFYIAVNKTVILGIQGVKGSHLINICNDLRSTYIPSFD